MDHLLKTKRIQKLKKSGDSIYIYQREPDKACFQHDRSYGDFKNLPRRRTSDKVLRDKDFNIADNPKYDEYQYGLASMVFKIFDKKSACMVRDLTYVSYLRYAR